MPPELAAAPTAAASGAAGAERLKVPTSLFALLQHAAHLTAETTTLQETCAHKQKEEEKKKLLFVSKLNRLLKKTA